MNELYQEVVWKDVTGYEEHYQISNYGEMISKDRFIKAKNGMTRFHSGRKLVQSIHNGYYQINLHHEGICKTRLVHILVAHNFIGERPEGLEINHINGVKTDNRACNLEYVTPLENTRHSLRLGLKTTFPCGSATKRNKLKEADILIVKKRLANGELAGHIAKDYGLDTTTIRAIKIGQTWKHINL